MVVSFCFCLFLPSVHTKYTNILCIVYIRYELVSVFYHKENIRGGGKPFTSSFFKYLSNSLLWNGMRTPQPYFPNLWIFNLKTTYPLFSSWVLPSWYLRAGADPLGGGTCLCPAPLLHNLFTGAREL
jgi:hypothetical protein